MKGFLLIVFLFYPSLTFAGPCADITGAGSELTLQQTTDYLHNATGMTYGWDISDGTFQIHDGAVKKIWQNNPTSRLEMDPDGRNFHDQRYDNWSVVPVEVVLQQGNFMDLNCDQHWKPKDSGGGWSVGIPCIQRSQCFESRNRITDPDDDPLYGRHDGYAQYERTDGPHLYVTGTEEQANNVNRAFVHLFHLLQTAYVASKPQDPFGK